MIIRISKVKCKSKNRKIQTTVTSQYTEQNKKSEIRAVLKIQKKIKFYHKVHKEIQTQSSQSIDFIGLGVLCVKTLCSLWFH